MIEIIAYKCEHCEKKILSSKSGMYKHESKCFANPEMRACRTCKHVENHLESGLKFCNQHKKVIGPEIPFQHFCPKYKQSERRF